MQFLSLRIIIAFKKSFAKTSFICFYVITCVATYLIAGLYNIQLKKLVVTQVAFPGAGNILCRQINCG